MPVQTDSRSGIKHGFDTGQDGWGADVNKNFQILAYERNIRILNTGINTPPTSPTEHDCYAVGGSPTGAWATWAQNSLAVWGRPADGSALTWINITPKEGWPAYNVNTKKVVVYENNRWVTSPVQGPRGLQGVKGDKGDAGPAGERGPRGEQGQDGADGSPGTAGQTGPKGDKGDKGDPGQDGAAGQRGPRGLPGEGVPAGGTDGQIIYKDGATDYQTRWDDAPSGGTGGGGSTTLGGLTDVTIATPANNQVLTYDSADSRWENKAPPAGERGPRGLPGPQGQQGTAGTPGAAGSDGAQGPAGATGPTGPRGPQGMKGDTGAKGDKGDPGQAGTDGMDGAKGSQGERGPKGDTGAGVPAGGTDGQIIYKVGTTNYITRWDDAPSGGGGGSGEQNVQADYTQTDTTADSYIQNKPDIAKIIADQAGGRIDDISQAFVDLALTVNSVTGDTVAFNDTGDVVKSINNVDPWTADRFSLLEIDGYDPMIIDNDYIRSKSSATPPISSGNIDTEFGDSHSQEFVLMRNGAPIQVSGSNPARYYTIRVGKSIRGTPLVGKVYPATSLTLTIKIGLLSFTATQGAKGDKGDTGARGPAGPAGSQGPQGPAGRDGRDGSAGAQGPAGPKGNPGRDGRDGTAGSIGPQGNPGPKGDKGDKGDQGDQGERGLRGPRGLKGDKGDSADLPLKLQDFSEALEDDEGWQDDTGTGAATVASTAGSLTTTLTQAKALTYGTQYTNPNGFVVTGYVMIVRVPEAVDESIFRLAEEEAPGDSTRANPSERYGDIYYQYSPTNDTLNWVRINTTADNGYYYYRVPTSRIRGDGMLYIQKFNRMVIDKTKVDAGYENWAEKGNTDLIPRSKMPPSVSKHAQEMVNQVRGISIASTSTAVNNSLNPFTRQLTLASTDHGVFFTDLQASVHSGSTSQLALDMTTVSLQNLSHMSQLRGTTAYDNSAGSVGNGLLVGSFDVNNTSGVKQGTVNCYIARNSSNQVGTYNSYVPETGASSSLAGQIIIDWEVSLLRTDSTGTGGGMGSGFTQAQIEEFARDAIAAAIVAGGGNVTAINHDQQNEIILNVKAGALTPATIARDSTDNTKASMLSVWKALFEIGSGGGASTLPALTDVTISNPTNDQSLVYNTATSMWINKTVSAVTPAPRSLPELYVTRQATDPANVLTIRDARGFLNETLLVGTTFNLYKGGTAASQTLLTGSPFTINVRISGGNGNATQKVQINKNVTFASSASPADTSTFSTDVYYMVVASRPAQEVLDLHAYDSAESFSLDNQNAAARGVAYNPVRSLISVIDGGTTKRHFAYSPTGGGSADTRYTQTLEGDPIGCSWDPDGRHLYVYERSTFKVYDFGASNNPASITIARVTSKEFSVSAWMNSIHGIKVTSGFVYILGKRYTNSNLTVDVYSKTGTRSAAQSDQLIVDDSGGEGLAASASLSQEWSAKSDGNYVANYISSTEASHFRPSFNFSGPFWSGRTSAVVIGDILYYPEGNNIHTYNVTTGASLGSHASSGITGLTHVFSVGKWLYFYGVPFGVYRIDTTSSTPYVFTKLTGNPIGAQTSAIANNRLYYFFQNRLNYRVLTGSASGGYTAHGAESSDVAVVSSFASSVSSMWSNGSDIFCGTRFNLSYGSVVKIDATTHVVSAILPPSTHTGNVYGGFNEARNIHWYKHSSWNRAEAFSEEGTRRVKRASKLRSFPLGSRQGTTYDVGYNESADKVYAVEGANLRTYDTTVTDADRNWQRNEILDIQTGGRGIHSLFFVGNNAYGFGETRVTSDYDLERQVTFRLPDFSIASDSRFNGTGDRPMFSANGKVFTFTTTSSRIREINLLSHSISGGGRELRRTNGTSTVVLGNGSYFVVNGNNLFLGSSQNSQDIYRFTIPAQSAFGSTVTATHSYQIAREYATSSRAGYRAAVVISGVLYLARSDQTRNKIHFDGYSLTDFSRQTNRDFTIDTYDDSTGGNTVNGDYWGLTLHNDILYITDPAHNGIQAYVRS